MMREGGAEMSALESGGDIGGADAAARARGATLRAGLATILALALLAPAPAMAETAIYAGAGPRFASGETSAVAGLRLSVDVAPLIAVAVELDGYLSAPGASSVLDIAGGQAGLVLALPVPGPVTPEVGLALGWVKLSAHRHGIDDSLAALVGELALRGSFGPVKVRAAWTRPIWSESAPLVERGITSQLMFSLGFGI